MKGTGERKQQMPGAGSGVFKNACQWAELVPEATAFATALEIQPIRVNTLLCYLFLHDFLAMADTTCLNCESK